jgi:hypothetical protein
VGGHALFGQIGIPCFGCTSSCGQKQPTMDRLYFYTKRMEETLDPSKPKIDKIDNTYKEMEGSEMNFKMLIFFGK